MEFIVTVSFLALLMPAQYVEGDMLDDCPPADPNCHPSCIVYTSDHCRYCMCKDGSAMGTGNSGSGYDFSSGMSTDAAWDRGIEGSDWSNKMSGDSNTWSNSGGSGGGSGSSWGDSGGSGGFSSGDKKETVKYVIVEKEPEPIYPHSSYGSGVSALSALPNPFPAGMASPFSGSHIPSALMPGSNHIQDARAYGSNVIHVPLLAPGIPKYCVRCHILSCPESCERIDEYGCRSCPCAPSRYQTMPVVKDCSDKVVMEPDCSATKLCMKSCSGGYQLGDVGRDGCQSCMCIHKAPPIHPPKTNNGCPATLSCMLKCKDGYLLGDKQADGCPSCKCLSKGANNNSSTSSNNNNNNNNNKNNINNNNKNNFGSGTNKWNSGASMNTGSTSGSSNKGSGCSGTKSNYLTSVNGIGSGKCEPPMCLDGHMSVEAAMKIGSDSAGGGGGCDEGHGGSGVMGGGSLAGGSNSFGMNSGGFGGGMTGSSTGGSGMGTGSGMGMGTGSGMGMGSFGMGTSGGSSSGKGMPSPFSVSMSGAGAGGGKGGMSLGGGGGGGAGGSAFSPFSSAMSGGGPGKGMAPGMGGLMGMPGRGMGSAMGKENTVSRTAYNKDCVGPECSAKNGMQHKDCPDLIHCLVTCDGSYMLGQLDEAGCQTCSCT